MLGAATRSQIMSASLPDLFNVSIGPGAATSGPISGQMSGNKDENARRPLTEDGSRNYSAVIENSLSMRAPLNRLG